MKRELFELDINHRMETAKNLRMLELAYENMVNSLRTWDKKYLIKSHHDGIVVWGKTWGMSARVNEGEHQRRVFHGAGELCRLVGAQYRGVSGTGTARGVHREVDTVVIVEIDRGEPVARAAVAQAEVERRLGRAFDVEVVPEHLVAAEHLLAVVARLREVGVRRIAVVAQAQGAVEESAAEESRHFKVNLRESSAIRN